MPAMPGPMRTRLLLVAAATTLAGAVAYWIHDRYGGPRSTMQVTKAADDTEVTWRGQDAFVVDAVAGLRPRARTTIRLPTVGSGPDEPAETVKHRDRFGFLREDELPEPIDRPCVLVLGDSHIDGVVDTADNVSTRLERRSEADGQPLRVLNAACGMYGLWQHNLRGRVLIERFRPRVVVVVVFLGNDFLDLENPTMPHLDDALQEQPEGTLDSAEPVRRRRRDLDLPEDRQMLFWQGLDQARFLQQQPERRPFLLAKAKHAVEALEAAAAAHGAKVLWALLPSYDLVFPERTAALSAVAAQVVASGAQRQMRDQFVRLLAQRQATVVDFEPTFRAKGGSALYASDFHVYRRGHELMAEALQAPLRALLGH